MEILCCRSHCVSTVCIQVMKVLLEVKLHSSGIRITRCHLSRRLVDSNLGCDAFMRWISQTYWKKTRKCKQNAAFFRITNVKFRRDFISIVGQVEFSIWVVHNTTWTNTNIWKVYGLALCPWTVHPLFPIQSKWMKSTMWMQREMCAMIWVRSQRKMFVQEKQLSE